MPELIAERGGTPLRSRVGHSYIKALMADTGAIFGGEHSAHYYFRDFWGADSGMLAALHVLAALGEQDRPLSELMADYQRYESSGEINFTVADAAALRGRGAEVVRHAGFTPSTTSTGSPSIWATAAGSTCAAPTPSRCCGSTSRPARTEEVDAIVAQVGAQIAATRRRADGRTVNATARRSISTTSTA